MYWKPVGGTILEPAVDDAEAWDHVQTGVVDVWEKSGESSSPSYEMLYLGASVEAINLGAAAPGPLEGFRMRCGVATGSSDGRTWDKAPENPVLNVGGEGEWDSLFVSWPRALPLDPAREDGPWLLTYHSLQPPNEEGDAKWAAGACISAGDSDGDGDGARLKGPWTKLGRILEGGAVGSWDERGIGTRHVVHDKGILWMVFEGVDATGRHRLGLASSKDEGRTWAKEEGYLFEGRPKEDGAWDSGTVGTPYLARRPGDAGWLLYYVGTSTDAATGKARYAIGCAEQCDPQGPKGLAGPWRRVCGTC